MVAAAEGGEAGRHERRVVDRRLLVPLEPFEQPACGDTRMALRLLVGDQRSQLEQVCERRPRDLGAERRLGDDEVAALDRPLEDRSRMALRGDPTSSPGPDGTPTLPVRVEHGPARSPGAYDSSVSAQGDRGLEENRGRSFVGNVQGSARDRGWFFGHFMDDSLLQSDLVEVCWQKVPNKTPAPEQRHLHRRTVEINIVIGGTVRLKIDDEQHDLGKGDFFVVWPECVVSDVETDGEAQVIVVRAPSVANDKFAVEAF